VITICGSAVLYIAYFLVFEAKTVYNWIKKKTGKGDNKLHAIEDDDNRNNRTAVQIDNVDVDVAGEVNAGIDNDYSGDSFRNTDS
jgi:hypothetical protein